MPKPCPRRATTSAVPTPSSLVCRACRTWNSMATRKARPTTVRQWSDSLRWAARRWKSTCGPSSRWPGSCMKAPGWQNAMPPSAALSSPNPRHCIPLRGRLPKKAYGSARRTRLLRCTNSRIWSRPPSRYGRRLIFCSPRPPVRLTPLLKWRPTRSRSIPTLATTPIL